MRHLTCTPDAEVSGAVLISLVENMQAENIAPFRKKYNLVNICEDQWYPLRNLLDLLNDLDSNNQTPSFVAIGLSIAEVALMPLGLESVTLADMLEGWDEHFHINHRNGDIGHKIAKKVDDHHYQLTLDGGIYPDDFEYGVVYGFAKRFLPPQTRFTIWYDESVRRLDQGGTQTIIHIKWEQAEIRSDLGETSKKNH